MARLFRCAALALILLATALIRLGVAESMPAAYFDRPVLVVDPGRHTARVGGVDIDGNERFAVTASDDKTVRIWAAATGQLVRTIRLPAGAGDIGKAWAVAIDPVGDLIAVAGHMPQQAGEHAHLFARGSGALVQRIGALQSPVNHLAFSPDGRRLVVALVSGGMRVFGRDAGWAEIARDIDYRGAARRIAFARDGRFAITSRDGRVRLYGPDSVRRAAVTLPADSMPFGIAFRPDGERLAVGSDGSGRQGTGLDVFDGTTLARLYSPDLAGIGAADMYAVAWGANGALFAGGRYMISGSTPVLAWIADGRGARSELPVGANSVLGLRALADGDLLVATHEPWFGRLSAHGRPKWALAAPTARLQRLSRALAVSADGRMVDFTYEAEATASVRFDAARLVLSRIQPADDQTQRPRQTGLAIAGWSGGQRPTLNGRPLRLSALDGAYGLAIHPDGTRFVLGAYQSLRAFDAQGAALWQRPVPAYVTAVNISGDGRLVIAAHGDGTIRWHGMDDGREVLAFMPLADRVNWVAWTPEGFYAASPGAHGVLRWHVNRPDWQPAASYPVADIPGFHRPTVIPLVLQEMETARAIGIAVIAEQRRQVQLLTNSRVPPGARLHVLAVGVSRYNERAARGLRLQFAQKDAQDVVSALGSTQNTLYVPGSRQYLADADATRHGILRSLAALRATVRPSDLAVVHFAGHAAMIDGELFLLPYEVDARDPVAIKSTALSVASLRGELLRIAEQGRVLLLLDACYSGAASPGRSTMPFESSRLAHALAAANVTVLTSSSASEASREDPAWQNGAFTEAVLEALGTDADRNHDGLISANELADYVERRVRALTRGRQNPAMEIRFGGTLFAVR